MTLRDRLPTALGVLAKAAFLGATGFALWNALIPASESSSLFPWDKLAHFTAFYVLTLLALPAFPRAGVATVAVGLMGLGVLIELLQMVPAVGRDAEAKDVIADGLGIAAALAPVVAWRMRELDWRPARAPAPTSVVDLPAARKLKDIA